MGELVHMLHQPEASNDADYSELINSAKTPTAAAHYIRCNAFRQIVYAEGTDGLVLASLASAFDDALMAEHIAVTLIAKTWELDWRILVASLGYDHADVYLYCLRACINGRQCFKSIDDFEGWCNKHNIAIENDLVTDQTGGFSDSQGPLLTPYVHFPNGTKVTRIGPFGNARRHGVVEKQDGIDVTVHYEGDLHPVKESAHALMGV